MRGASETAGSSTTRINRGEGAWLEEVTPSFRRLWAQDIVSFGYGSQSREIMEVEDYSAKSGCYGAFERRRETSTMEEFNKRMDEMESRIIQAIRKEMRMNQNRSTTGGMLMNENQSSTVVRVKVEREEKAAVIIQALCGLPWCG